MASALSQYRIVEFGDHSAVAVLGMFLADQGADVIKIEPPEGDPLRGYPVFSVWNRGKKSVVSDPPEAKDRLRLLELVKDSDVVIEGFESGVNPYGIDYETARDQKPNIIHLSIPGASEDRNLSSNEIIVSAATGVYVDRSSDRTEGASFISLPYASVFGAMVAAPALTAALFHRAGTGQGQAVVVPLYDSMFTAMGSAIVRRPDVPAGPGALSPAIARFYRCADGRWVNLNATYERSLRPMLTAMGHPEWYDALTDERLRVNVEEREEWAERFAEVWLQKSAAEWEDIMASESVPVTMCRTLREWMETKHASQSGAVVEIDDPVYGPMRQVGIQVRLQDAPGSIRRPAPHLGQHSESLS